MSGTRDVVLFGSVPAGRPVHALIPVADVHPTRPDPRHSADG
ncbi:hypothetical protein [Streptomyces pilosus]|nr:hypothetical protein [Streptomyces pilosus]